MICSLIESLQNKIKSQAHYIEWLIQCDDSFTEVMGKMDEEIEILKRSCEAHQVIARQRLDRIKALEVALKHQKEMVE